MSKVGSAACEALSRLGAVLPVDPAALSDGQLIDFVGRVEAASRQIDALKLAAARAVSERSVDGAPDSLARRLGFKTAAGALQGLTKSSGKDAAKLIHDVEDLAKLPAVEEAVMDGRIGREAAAAIAGELKKAAGKNLGGVDSEELQAVQTELVELATSVGADEVKAKAAEKAATLNIMAVEDKAAKAMGDRFFWIGPTVDGAARVSGLLPAGHAAVIRGVLDGLSNPKGKKTVTFTPDADQGQVPADVRTRGQKAADHLRDVFATAARSAEIPDMGGDHPTVWISTTAAELHSGAGLAFYAGASEPVSVQEAQQAACTGGIQTVIFGENGDVLNLGLSVRGFTKRQRRAIALRDGGTCVIPGCEVPAQWCEVHHVIPHQDGGATDVCNGVLLCWFHHHEIDSGPWQVRMRHGTPEVRYAAAGKVIDWHPVGDGAAAHIKAGSPPGSGARE
ncbi:HNH endonuclease [Gryllotalpicola protaetiae]|uniref:HNH endonuclease n=1 Tax=Gryllotalpicola protaetiae TaxID=2419771 RepID=A0A387BJH1_9MICO|nr:HNH endonuclease signature motif containing protein [Gryllotalpicola protaetiae]AYG02304.1 HNH endonuclease [Gryllotalpicola protaetiae]